MLLDGRMQKGVGKGRQTIFIASLIFGLSYLSILALGAVTANSVNQPAANSYINESFENTNNFTLNATTTVSDNNTGNITNMTFWLSNSSNLRQFFIANVSNTSTFQTNFTFSWNISQWSTNNSIGLVDGIYNVTADATNASATNTSDNNINVTIDFTDPSINYFGDTPATNSNLSQNYLIFNVTALDSTAGLDNITVYVYNSTTLVTSNTTSITSTITSNKSFGSNFTSLANAIYTINATVNDSAGNEAVLALRTITLDNTTPTITHTLDDASVLQDDDITATCTATDNVDSGVTTNFVSSPATNIIGTFTLTCWGVDDSGNNGTADVSYTVSKRSGGGGGGGGGGSSPSVAHTFAQITPGSAAILKITDPDTGLKQISIMVDNPANSVRITVVKLDGQPASVTHEIEGEVYKYMEINAGNLNDDNIAEAKVAFTVAKEWLAANGLDKGKVVLFRYDGGWKALDTRVVSENSNSVEYEATTPGFSYFAIGAKESAVSQPPADTEVGQQPPTQQEVAGEEERVPLSLIFIGAIVLLAIIVAVTYFTRSLSMKRK